MSFCLPKANPRKRELVRGLGSSILGVRATRAHSLALPRASQWPMTWSITMTQGLLS